MNLKMMLGMAAWTYFAPTNAERWQQFDRGGKYKLAREERAKARRRKARK